MEYILYCDESIDKDTKYGDFFGGCIISSSDLQMVIDALEHRGAEPLFCNRYSRHSSCQGQFYPFSELGLSFDEIKQVHMDYPVSVLQQIICRHHIFGVVVPDQLKRSVFAILCFLA